MRTVLILIGMVAFAQGQWPPPGMRCPERTLVLCELSENAANQAKLAQEHLSYMLGLMKSGKIITAGPMSDHRTAAIVFASKDWSEVEQLLDNEPFHREHMLKVTSHGIWTACEAAP